LYHVSRSVSRKVTSSTLTFYFLQISVSSVT
jgi:hypothetical protein